MTRIHRNAWVPYTAEEMFQLVHDVPRYPEFVPWCTQAGFLEQLAEEATAQLTFSRASLSKSFVTRNRYQFGKILEMSLVDGPFEHLNGFWRFQNFEPVPQCRVDFDLSFEVKGKLLKLTFAPLLNQVADRLVDAFVERAEKIYGER